MSFSTKPVTAAIIVIGDEILKGYTLDTNSNFLSKRLRRVGISVNRISVIPDNVDIIADEVRRCSGNFTFVFTSGGIGPTHDDMTFEGVAKATDDQVAVNKELAAVIEKFFGKQESEATPAMKLALVPSKSQLIWGVDQKTGDRSLFPVVTVGNITVLPGVPKLLERAFDIIEDRVKNSGTTFCNEKIFITTDEVSIATGLTDLAKRYAEKVNFGSYPAFGHSYYKVKLTLDSTDKPILQEALTELLRILPSDCVVDYDENAHENVVPKVASYLDGMSAKNPEFHAKLSESIRIIEKAFETYRWNEISIAFNGGKDCTALLHLVYAVACKIFQDVPSNRKLKAIYLRPRLPFEEMEKFIEEGQARYNLELLTCKGNVKEALFSFTSAHPDVKAVFMGTRASDPNSHQLEACSKTDPGWPELMRISPMIKWTYGEMWRFLRDLYVPYCSLYDRGYTSLGNKDNTEKNPSLAYKDALGNVRYRPAYTLMNESLERDGRKTNGI